MERINLTLEQYQKVRQQAECKFPMENFDLASINKRERQRLTLPKTIQTYKRKLDTAIQNYERLKQIRVADNELEKYRKLNKKLK